MNYRIWITIHLSSEWYRKSDDQRREGPWVLKSWLRPHEGRESWCRTCGVWTIRGKEQDIILISHVLQAFTASLLYLSQRAGGAEMEIWYNRIPPLKELPMYWGDKVHLGEKQISNMRWNNSQSEAYTKMYVQGYLSQYCSQNWKIGHNITDISMQKTPMQF